ncbi:MAG: glucosaminidase domain-containing protein [Bacteroidales bacterium]|nr:glucosaminidase domain-containing protein [Candidatus Cacconaster caballi]
MRYFRGLLFLSFMLLFSLPCEGQQKRTSRQQYIDKYSKIAVEEMLRSGIPASITLAQGCLESSDGNSRLASEGNNHFGIKCHGSWKGRTIYEDDDRRRECFRRYSSAEDSYRDHTDFLLYGSRYAFLFKLDRTDYKGWAYGLKKAGYATASDYAPHLIRIIEENNLQRFDHLKTTRTTGYTNGVAYIIAGGGDSYRSIAREYNLFKKELLSFNDLERDEKLKAGTIVYLEYKKRKGPDNVSTHTVKKGDTVYGISQQYAIRLRHLCKYNNFLPDDTLVPGTTVFLKKRR